MASLGTVRKRAGVGVVEKGVYRSPAVPASFVIPSWAAIRSHAAWLLAQVSSGSVGEKMRGAAQDASTMRELGSDSDASPVPWPAVAPPRKLKSSDTKPFCPSRSSDPGKEGHKVMVASRLALRGKTKPTEKLASRDPPITPAGWVVASPVGPGHRSKRPMLSNEARTTAAVLPSRRSKLPV